MASILVIDSDPGTRASMVHALAGLCDVEQATNSAEALRLLAAHKYTIVVLDLHVRPLDGFILLRTLTSRAGPNQKTPVYAVAADQAEQARALREHVVYALMKPVSPATLANLVEAGIRRAEAPPAAEESPPPSSVTTKPTTMPPPREVTRSPAMGAQPDKPAAADRVGGKTPPSRPSPLPPPPEGLGRPKPTT